MNEMLVDPTELTVRGLVSARVVSARLRKCLAANPSIGDLTVAQFLADSGDALGSLLSHQNFGARTAGVLYALVSTAGSGPIRVSTASNMRRHSEENAAFEALVGLMAPIPFPAACLAADLSKRLRGSLEQVAERQLTPGCWEADAANLGSVLEKWPEIRRELLHQANFGRTSLAELEAIIETIVRATLDAYSSGGELPPIKMANLSERHIGVRLREILSDVDGAHAARSPPDILGLLLGLDSKSGLSPREHVLKALSRLTEKEAAVITRRFGLQGGRPETFETMSAQFHFTREGVRQIAMKALRRLRIQSNRQAFERLVDIEQDVVWNLLANGSDLLLARDLRLGLAKVPGDFLLAVEVVHGGVGEWLATQGRVADGGWLKDTENRPDIEESLRRIAAWAAVAPGPIPLAAMAELIGVSADHLPFLLRFCKNIKIFEGYICSGQVRAQVMRTCRLHRLATGLGELRLFDVATLYRAYASGHPGDPAFLRTIQEHMEHAPHLFFRMFDGIWVAIGSAPRANRDVTTQSIPFERAVTIDGPEFGQGSICEWLHSTLSDKGPMTIVDLQIASRTAFLQDRSQSSIGPVLHMNAEFVRIAPGVFGLQHHVAALTTPSCEVPASLLSDAQCRQYAASSKAGDPIGLYPAWNHPFEAALCRWAANHASDDRYRSVLMVSNPSKWGLPPEEEAAWLAKRRDLGSFGPPRWGRPRNLVLPPAADFLAAALYLWITGSIAWTTVNRTAGRRIDSQKAAATLALLAQFGMAAPAEAWRGRHHALPATDTIVIRLVSDLSRKGTLSWDEDTLLELRNAPVNKALRLFFPQDVAAMLAGGNASADRGRLMNPATPAEIERMWMSRFDHVAIG